MKILNRTKNAQEHLSSQGEVFIMSKNEFSHQLFEWSNKYGISESKQKELEGRLLKLSLDMYNQYNDDSYQTSREVQEELVVKKESIPAKKFNLSGGVFYQELKPHVSNPNSMMDCYNKEFREFLDNAKDIQHATDLYSLVLQEAIKEKDTTTIKEVLNQCDDLKILLNLNRHNENAILYTIRSQDKDIVDLLHKYIHKINVSHNKFTLDEILSGYISNEFSFNVPHEEQDDYYQKLIVPLYGENGGE